MSEFLQAFWPNLCATVLGVVLGLPVALYVNQRLTASQRLYDATAEAARRNEAIDVLIHACAYNAGRLDAMNALTLEGKALRNPDLQVTAWDAVSPVFSPVCSDPKLLQQLSHHWLRLQRLERLNSEVFARTVGALPPLPDEDIMRGMWGELHEGTLDLAAHTVKLREKLARLKTSPARVAREALFAQWRSNAHIV